ncbi:hypothetical protein [Goodfellowiella coeruleoviolacea]|uniref:Extracellular repeat, HAF family n=1 Tax=Goodfellowiella coeruleoviolacea TaxID=334858 RepID=A0AAE3GAH8_9PSEU|nr:hypothetical protein [Goodfellowiella coeruleoviolacea]MCP2164702.1 hypothetical protein [Goodfellowiella coeruleoviolacea]
MLSSPSRRGLVVRLLASVGVVASALATGGVAVADTAVAHAGTAAPACAYQPTQLPGVPGSRVATGYVQATDGGRYFGGLGHWSSDGLGGDHRGLVWRDGVVVADFGSLSHVTGVNSSGDAVGGTESVEPLTWHDGRLGRLSRPPQNTRHFAQASAVSDTGVVIGSATFDDGTVHALAWSIHNPTAPRDLGIAGRLFALTDISDDDRIVGTFTSGSRLQAVTGTVDGGFRPLGGVDPAADSSATDIAGSYVLGTATVPGQGKGAVLWRDGVPRLLTGAGTATLTDVNSSGTVVGYEGTDYSRRTAVVLSGGTRTVLPPLPGYTHAEAMAVTDDGRIAGRSIRSGSDAQFVPTVWSCA